MPGKQGGDGQLEEDESRESKDDGVDPGHGPGYGKVHGYGHGHGHGHWNGPKHDGCSDSCNCGSCNCDCHGKGPKKPKTKKKLGQSCSTDAECASGFCPGQDGVCCEAACDDSCLSCSSKKTQKPDGVCAAVLADTDPDAECSSLGVQSCGANGTGCNGNSDAPACNTYPTGSICGAKYCKSGVAFAPAACHESGVCLAGAPTLCGPYRCDDNGIACLTWCTSDSDCVDSTVCSAGACVQKPPELTKQGQPCSADEQCATGYCVDGVCCDGGCNGTCSACALPGQEGTCALVTADQDQDNECGAGHSCDGMGSCKPDAKPNSGLGWSKRFGDAGMQLMTDVAIDSAGNVVAAGYFAGTIDLGAGPMVSKGDYDTFVAKFTSDGKLLWSKAFGSAESQLVDSITVDKADNIVATGTFFGDIDFGGGTLSSNGGVDIFAVKLNADGKHVWSKRFGDASHQWAAGVAVDPAGDVVLLGYFFSSIDLGGGVLQSAGFHDVFVAKLSAAGKHLWSKRYGDSDAQYAAAVAVDPAGDIVISGNFKGTMHFGPTSHSSEGGFYHGDVFLAKLSPKGDPLWSQRFGDGDEQRASDVAIDAKGNIVLGGWMLGNPGFGGGPLFGTGGMDSFVAKFDMWGAHLWSKHIGDADDAAHSQYLNSVAVDSAGNVLLTGVFAGLTDFGGGPVKGDDSSYSGDVFLVRLSPAGVHLYSKGYGDTEGQRPAAVVADGQGNAILGGEFYGQIDFGSGTLVSSGTWDGFIAKVPM